MPVEGVEKIMGALNAKISEIKTVGEEALYEAAQVVRTDAVEITPKRYGDLRGSADVTKSGHLGSFGASGPVFVVHFGTDYAIYVHENMEARHKIGGPKFLERAVIKNQGRVLGIIHAKAKF